MAPAAQPIVIGVADIVNRSLKVEDAREPLDLMVSAIKEALKDAGVAPSKTDALQSSIDSIDVVQTWTWPYPDLPSSISQNLRINARRKHQSPHGGNQPGKLFDEAARRISQGETKVAVLTGGEALASLTSCAVAKKLPPPGWSQPSQAVDSVFSPTTRELQNNLGAIHDIGAPIHVYPLFEHAFRAHRGQTIKKNNSESAKLYADFAKVAEKNEYAWNYGKAAAEEFIGTVSKRNRMICSPYPLLMNAFNTVNLAAAVILTSTDYARELGVPESKWIYALGGAGTSDSGDFWLRPNYHSSASISRSIDAALEVSRLTKDDIDLYCLYSCFPIVPKLAAHHLGLSITNPSKPLTLLGGLTSFGGAGNNYSTHSITEMTRHLRANKHRNKNGLILANGGVATYQHVVCLSTQPRQGGGGGAGEDIYPQQNPLPEYVDDIPVPPIAATADGEAVVETYTVEFNRDGSPLRGHVVGRLKATGQRFLANHADEFTLRELCSGDVEGVGRVGWVRPEEHGKGRNLFSFGAGRGDGGRESKL